MFTPSLMLLSKSSSTTPPGQEQEGTERTQNFFSLSVCSVCSCSLLFGQDAGFELVVPDEESCCCPASGADFIIAVIQCDRRAAVKPSRVFGSVFASSQEARKRAFSGVRVFFFGNEDQYQTTSETKGPAARPLGSARGGRDKWLATSPRLFPALSPCPRSGAARFDSRSR